MSNYSVEGDWGDFEFRTVQKSDYPVVMKHIHEVFCKTAPLLSRVGYSVEMGNDICDFAMEGLKKGNGLSFMAIHKESQKLAGLRITYKVEKDEENSPLNVTSESTSNILRNISDMSKTANIFERYEVNYYAELLMASVDPEFREKGLATEMYRRTLDLLRSKGYPITYGNFTSPFSRKVATKLGFEEIVRRYFKDFKDVHGFNRYKNLKIEQQASLVNMIARSSQIPNRVDLKLLTEDMLRVK